MALAQKNPDDKKSFPIPQSQSSMTGVAADKKSAPSVKPYLIDFKKLFKELFWISFH